MNLKAEQYKGYPIRFVEKIIGSKKYVVGDFPSKIVGKNLAVQGSTKDYVLTQCKKMIDKEVKIRGLK